MKYLTPIIACAALIILAGCNSGDSQSGANPGTNALSEQATMPENPVATAAPAAPTTPAADPK